MKNSSYGYAKLAKEDPEELMHRRAQFLIYKALKKADIKRSKPSFLRLKLGKLKVKIGRKLRKSILVTISAARIRFYKQILCQLKLLFKGSSSSLPNPLVLP